MDARQLAHDLDPIVDLAGSTLRMRPPAVTTIYAIEACRSAGASLENDAAATGASRGFDLTARIHRIRKVPPPEGGAFFFRPIPGRPQGEVP
jgi:hypothetical protein